MHGWQLPDIGRSPAKLMVTPRVMPKLIAIMRLFTSRDAKPQEVCCTKLNLRWEH